MKLQFVSSEILVGSSRLYLRFRRL